jgi:hypothetical protein
MESEEGQKSKGGRPLKFSSVDDLQIKIDAYFGNCDPHRAKRILLRQKANGQHYVDEEEYITEQVPYTITGLALALDTTRETLRDYESGKYDDAGRSEDENSRFSDTIIRAKLRCEQFAEMHLFTGKNANGAIFSLKNNYNWVDKSEVDNTVHTVEADLDSLDKEREQMAAQAAKALEEANGGGEGSPAQEQVVAADAPLQNQG